MFNKDGLNLSRLCRSIVVYLLLSAPRTIRKKFLARPPDQNIADCFPKCCSEFPLAITESIIPWHVFSEGPYINVALASEISVLSSRDSQSLRRFFIGAAGEYARPGDACTVCVTSRAVVRGWFPRYFRTSRIIRNDRRVSNSGL